MGLLPKIRGPCGLAQQGSSSNPSSLWSPQTLSLVTRSQDLCFTLSSVPRGVYQEGPLAAPCFGSPFGGRQTGPRGTAVRSSEQAAVFPTDTQTPVFLVK